MLTKNYPLLILMASAGLILLNVMLTEPNTGYWFRVLANVMIITAMALLIRKRKARN